MDKLLISAFFFTAVLTLSFEICAKPSVSIDSLSGTAEIQRSGSITWNYATKNTKLFNNDLIRVSDSSVALLDWPDGNRTYINKNTQILISLYQKKGNTDIMSNVTVMFGAAFFIIKKILPSSKNDGMKVYTPTSVMSIRGTSFLVDVDTAVHKTTIKMVSGMLLVRNISRNVSVLLSTPYKTFVEIGNNPSAPAAILKEEIDSMKIWIPEPVIDLEISEQLNNYSDIAAKLKNDFQQECLVTQFVNTSKYKGEWKIEKEISRFFAAQLRQALAETVVRIADSATSDPLETARSINANFLVTGTIDRFDILKHAQISMTGDEYRESAIAIVTVSIKLIDVSENKEVLSKSFTAEVTGKNTKENSPKALHSKPFIISGHGIVKTIIGSAAESAVNQTVAPVSRYINEK